MLRIHVHLDQETAGTVKRIGGVLKSRLTRVALVGTLVAIPVVAIASPYMVPNTFTSGTVISSSEVNANFTAARTAIDDNDTRITTLEGNTMLSDCTWTHVTAPSGTDLLATCPVDTHPISGGCSSSGSDALRVSRPMAIDDGDPHTAAVNWYCVWTGASSSKAAYALCCAP